MATNKTAKKPIPKPKTDEVEEQQLPLQDAVKIETPEPPVEDQPWSEKYEGEDPQQGLEIPPMQQFEMGINEVIGKYAPQVPLPIIVGFLELKLIEFKESWRLETERRLRSMMTEKTHGDAQS